MRQLVIIYGNKLIGYLDETGMVENVPFKIIAQGTYDPEGDQEDKDFEAREQQAKIVYDQAHNAAKMKYKEKFEEATASIDLATVDTRDLDRLTREVNDAAQYEATEIFKKDGKKAYPVTDLSFERAEARVLASQIRLRQRLQANAGNRRSKAAVRDRGDEKKLALLLTKLQRMIHDNDKSKPHGLRHVPATLPAPSCLPRPTTADATLDSTL